MSWQSLSPVGVLGMAGMRVIPLRGLAPKGLILIDSGLVFSGNKERMSQRKGERAANISLMWEVTSSPSLAVPSSSGTAPSTSQVSEPKTRVRPTLCQSHLRTQLTTCSICFPKFSLALSASVCSHRVSYPLVQQWRRTDSHKSQPAATGSSSSWLGCSPDLSWAGS